MNRRCLTASRRIIVMAVWAFYCTAMHAGGFTTLRLQHIDAVLARQSLKHEVCRRVNSYGEVEHIGLKLFSSELRGMKSSPTYDFLERQLLELNIYSGEEKSRLAMQYSFTFTIGSETTALSIDSTCQYTEDELEYHRYRATWAKNDKEILQVVFPKNWQLMSGCDMPELEASFERRLMRHHMADLSPLPVKGSWIVTPQMSSKLYLADGKERRTDKHSRSYVCSSRQITHSVRNLMLADDMEHEVQMEVHLVRYGFATDTLRLPLKKFLNYCRKEEGCSPYFGIKSRTADSTEGLLLLANPQGGFMHMLSVTIDDQVIAERKGVVQGKLYPYIPIYNVRKEYLNLTEYENPD